MSEVNKRLQKRRETLNTDILSKRASHLFEEVCAFRSLEDVCSLRSWNNQHWIIKLKIVNIFFSLKLRPGPIDNAKTIAGEKLFACFACETLNSDDSYTVILWINTQYFVPSLDLTYGRWWCNVKFSCRSICFHMFNL